MVHPGHPLTCLDHGLEEGAHFFCAPWFHREKIEPIIESHREVHSNLTKVRPSWIIKLHMHGIVVSGNDEFLSLKIFKPIDENLLETL